MSKKKHTMKDEAKLIARVDLIEKQLEEMKGKHQFATFESFTKSVHTREYGNYQAKAIMKPHKSFKIASGENRQFRIQMTRDMARMEKELHEMYAMPSRSIIYELGLRYYLKRIKRHK